MFKEISIKKHLWGRYISNKTLKNIPRYDARFIYFSKIPTNTIKNTDYSLKYFFYVKGRLAFKTLPTTFLPPVFEVNRRISLSLSDLICRVYSFVFLFICVWVCCVFSLKMISKSFTGICIHCSRGYKHNPQDCTKRVRRNL